MEKAAAAQLETKVQTLNRPGVVAPALQRLRQEDHKFQAGTSQNKLNKPT
jgi:hypothetical protein